MFYFSLKKNYQNIISSHYIFLISSIILLSPYFRTSSYWGLEENFGIFAVITSVLFYQRIIFENKENKQKFLILLAFFSSLCVYFDQKLIIIPIFFYLNLLLSNKIYLKDKISTSIGYFIFSIPFLYLIYLWQNIIPVTDANVRSTLEKIFLKNIGFSLSIIAFYIFPFLFLKKKNFFSFLKEKLKNYKIFYLFICLIIYLFLLIQFDPLKKEFLGNGLIYKFSIVAFDNFEISKVFLYLSFFASVMIIYLFIDDYRDYLFILILILSSIFIAPLYQEYYDPIMLILRLVFFYTKLSFNFLKTIFIYSYFFMFFIVANIYYKSNLFLFFNDNLSIPKNILIESLNRLSLL